MRRAKQPRETERDSREQRIDNLPDRPRFRRQRRAWSIGSIGVRSCIGLFRIAGSGVANPARLFLARYTFDLPAASANQGQDAEQERNRVEIRGGYLQNR